MRYIVIGLLILMVINTKGDPLALIAFAATVYFITKSETLKQAIRTLEFWKEKEFEARENRKDAITTEKSRRLAVRELRTSKNRRTTRFAKELKAIERAIPNDQRQVLQMLQTTNPDAFEELVEEFGLEPKVVKKWLGMSQGELERKKSGLD